MITRVASLEDCARNHISSVKTDFQFWGASRLFEAFRTPQNRTLRLEVLPSILMNKGSVVCLATLHSMYKFLTDEQGIMRHYLLEPNVRDYQGVQNPVNKAIRETLQIQKNKEFWWLNNGITVVADQCVVGGDGVTIEGAEIVNGLQTCHEIYNHFKGGGTADERSVLVRIIQTPEEQTRNDITKATNNQTPVSALSLRATEPLHFEIEDRLKLYDLYYDRKKGKYRRLKKPVAKSISMRELGQAVIAVVLQAPDDARARPMSVLKSDRYSEVFDPNADRNLFVASILLDRQVVQFLKSRDDLTADARADIRYYMDTWLGAEMAGRGSPSKRDIANMVDAVNSPIPLCTLENVSQEVWHIYIEQGADDRAAKGPHMKRVLLDRLKAKFDAQGFSSN